MYAIFESGGKQHRVSTGEKVRLEKLDGTTGDKVVFDRVLMTGGEGEANIGQPMLEGASIEGEIVEQGRAKKILVYKRKRRKGFQKKLGHRQPFTEVKITGIKA